MDKKFKNGVSTAYRSANATAINNLKTGKRYYFKVRAYVVDSTGKKIFGNYSSAESVIAK